MSRWKAILSLLCLAIWLPATQHCKLENVPGLEFLRCPSDTPTSSNCDGDGCSTVESGAYKPSDNQRVVAPPAPLLVVFLVQPFVLDGPVTEVWLEVPTPPPPELSKSWQFISRTALPVRAPSFAS